MFLLTGGRRENIIWRAPNRCALSEAERAGYDEVWYADLCPLDVADEDPTQRFKVFDHHASNAAHERLRRDPRYTFDLGLCGTTLLARELSAVNVENPVDAEEIMPVLDLIEAYDLGRFDNEEAVFLADLASTYDQDRMLDLLYDGSAYDGSVMRVDAARNMRMQYARQAARQAYYGRFSCEAGDYTYGVVTSPVYWKNEVAQAVLRGERHPDFCAVIDVAGGMVSLRSLDKVDVSYIAGLFGGGGHRNAAGFAIRGQLLNKGLWREATS